MDPPARTTSQRRFLKWFPLILTVLLILLAAQIWNAYRLSSEFGVTTGWWNVGMDAVIVGALVGFIEIQRRRIARDASEGD